MLLFFVARMHPEDGIGNCQSTFLVVSYHTCQELHFRSITAPKMIQNLLPIFYEKDLFWSQFKFMWIGGKSFVSRKNYLLYQGALRCANFIYIDGLYYGITVSILFITLLSCLACSILILTLRVGFWNPARHSSGKKYVDYAFVLEWWIDGCVE